MIDTHTHIYLEDFAGEQDEVVRRAKDSGVSSLILPNVDLSTVPALLATVAMYPDYCRAAMGLHPTSVDAGYREALAETERLLSEGDYCAVGEIGIDLYWDKTYLREQQDAFAVQTRWAMARRLPVIIHCREAFNEITEVLRSVSDAALCGVFHSFTGTAGQVREARSIADFYFGINGIVTFKNARLEDMVREVGIDRLLLETDAPYLAPVPYRGKRNEPSYLPEIAKRIAAILDLTTDEVVARTTNNAMQLFGI